MFCITIMSLTQNGDLRFSRSTSTHCCENVPEALKAHMAGRLQRWRPPRGVGASGPPIAYLSIVIRPAPPTGECPHAPIDEAMLVDSFDVSILGGSLAPLYLASGEVLKELNNGKRS